MFYKLKSVMWFIWIDIYKKKRFLVIIYVFQLFFFSFSYKEIEKKGILQDFKKQNNEMK